MSDSDYSKKTSADKALRLTPDFSANYFQLLGLKEAYNISLDELEKTWLALQKKAHPDQFVSDARGKRVAVQYTSFINEAYETLRSPLLRAQYLLDLYGVSVDPETITHDNNFLMEQMDLRETLGEIKEEENVEQSLRNFIQDISCRINNLQNQFNALWQKRENGSLKSAADTLQKMYFFYKLMDEASAEEARLQGI